ncbi:hypothetical protein QAD02_008895 [Eretmocerus hayati]|uniref:Uncharacterized protein n=1 Tax=Eretmocerus hayati TaxID=131215 RepID=A0ACC2N919_9HYME|nr:hypothetical protein QAD02_008895 [Eretmocerus hayati]
MFSIIVVTCLLALVAGDPIQRHLLRPSTKDNQFSPSSGRIVGGEPADIEDHPWQASLQIAGFHFCGGSIISKDIILTAGHCTTSYPAASITVRVGSHTKDQGGDLIQVAQVIRHEDYSSNRYGIPINDVALLKLSRPIEFSDKAQEVGLFDLDEAAKEGTAATISGWGSLEEGGFTPNILYSVEVPIITKKLCNKAYNAYGGIPKGQICAAYPLGGKDSCQGDSGGPLVINKRQAGIVSWGNGCARKGFPGVYTEIAAFRDWIKEHARV